jgi:hypothetical protein
MRSLAAVAAFAALAACVPVDLDSPRTGFSPDGLRPLDRSESGPLGEMSGEVAVLRIAEGDTLSQLAERLRFPGGWHALAAANGIRGDFLRATAGLRVPVDYLRRAGVDPYATFALERIPPRAQPRSLAACAAEAVAGACVDAGELRACLEFTPPDDPSDPFDDEWPDGATNYPHVDGARVVVSRGGVEVAAIAVPNGALGGELEALRADLDGDGRTELVVVVPEHVRNHLAMTYAHVLVVGDGGVAQLSVAEWGDGSLIASEDGRGCDLLATTWDELRHPFDAASGLYLVGRPMTYAGGALVPRGGEVVRRMRTFFHASERDERPQPAAWLSTPEAEWWPELALDPGCGANARTSRDGTVTAARAVRGGIALAIAFDGGERAELAPDIDVDHVALGMRLERIGSLATNMLMPEDYAPANVATWVGRRARVDDCDLGELAHYSASVWL